MNLRKQCHLYIKLCSASAALVMLGSVILLSSSSIYGISSAGTPLHFFQRHLLWLFLGAVAFFLVKNINTSNLERYSVPIFVLSIGILLLPVFMGGLRWIRVGPLSFQPAELVKLTFIIYLAKYLTKRQADIKKLRVLLVPILFLFFVTGILQLQRDVGTFFVIAVTFGMLFFLAGAHRKHISVFAVAIVIIFWGLVLLFPYRMQRIRTFRDYESDPLGAGYQTRQAMITMGSGGLLGKGLGAGNRKLMFLPEAHTDYVYAVVGEEGGFLGTSLVLVLFAVVVFCGFEFARLAENNFDKLLCAGISGLLGVQFLLHASVVLNLVPAKGTTLPFFSVGGSSFLINIIALALLQNVGRKVCFDDPVKSCLS